MGLIKEPKNVDFIIESKPWTEEELIDFRQIMNGLKGKNVLKKPRTRPTKKKRIVE